MAKLIDRLFNLPVVSNIIDWSKNHALPGFDQVPIFYIIKFIFEELRKDNITTRADAVAFNFFLSIFPFIIFILPIIASTPLGNNYVILARESIRGILPTNAESYIFELIGGIEQEGNFGLLSIGFFLALYFSSNGMSKLMEGFDKSYNTTFKNRSFLKHRAIALGLTILLFVLLTISIGLIVLGTQLVELVVSTFALSAASEFIFFVLRWMIVFILFYSVITSIYRYGPSMLRKIRLFSPGASLATFLSIFSSVIFSYFVNNFGKYNEIYGSIGALIVVLVWLQINAFILLIGFELNASIAVNGDLRRAKPII